MSEINLEIDARAAAEELEDASDSIGEAGREIVDTLSMLAEKHMKAQAPEGAGSINVHMRSTIKPFKTPDGTAAVIEPHKNTREGWPLHHAVVGNPSTPTYGDDPPPVWTDGSGNALGPLADWSAAKLGDPNLAWPVSKSIQRDGQTTFPNRFVDRSFGAWAESAEEIAEVEIRGALE